MPLEIYSAKTIREWDKYTIQNEPISSIDLMERAAYKCAYWLMKRFKRNANHRLWVFCGSGNNGGDGLVIARYLNHYGYNVEARLFMFEQSGTEDFQTNLDRCRIQGVSVKALNGEESFRSGDIIIDALLGSGLNRKPEGRLKDLIERINKSGCDIISIDIPTGMFAEPNPKLGSGNCIKAKYTLSFQSPKLSFLLPETGTYAGEFHLLNIGLLSSFAKEHVSPYKYLMDEDIRNFLKQRTKFSHKGSYGHAFVIAGSEGKCGAALLSGKAALITGSGLVTLITITDCAMATHAHCPELMVMDIKKLNYDEASLTRSNARFAIGPGLGTHEQSLHTLKKLLEKVKSPIVFDADALNLFSRHKELLEGIPEDSILTPHPGEFERLVGACASDMDRLGRLNDLAKATKSYVILKGAHTAIACKGEEIYFNSTGSPGMATAGSGDVLTGMAVSLLGQGYSSKQAALASVYIHGKAGERAAKRLSETSLKASDIIESIPGALAHLV